MQVSGENIQELRKRFLEKLQQEHSTVPDKLLCIESLSKEMARRESIVVLHLWEWLKVLRYGRNTIHPFDIDRVKNSDAWLRRFLLHHDNDVKEAFNMLWDACEWRKSYNVNDINENTVNIDYIKEGGLFPYGFDKDGKPMLIFKCKMHVKGTKNFEELKRCLIYWFERMDRQYNGDQITVFFDMADTGLSNMDMEYTKYMINLNKLYYPHFLNYILIFEMPWVLNAAFKIIKSWLPTKAVQKIKFINKATLKEYVDPKYVLMSWGGEDEFQFNFIPEVRVELTAVSSSNSKFEDMRKKVHFSGVNHSSNENSPVSTTFRDTRSDDIVCQSNLLSIIHPDTIYFNCIDGEYIGLINVENISGNPVLFKVKTTSPERFRVKPSFGIIQQAASMKITVTVQGGGSHMHSILKDKFLVMSMIASRDDLTSPEIMEIWKQSEGVKIEQHRLKVSVIEPVTQCYGGKHVCGLSEELVHKVEQLKTMVEQVNDCNVKVRKEASYKQNLLVIVILFLVLTLLVLLYFVYQERSILQQLTSFASSSSCSTCSAAPDI